MLIDLLNSSNYLMINIDAIHIFGLDTAVYCAELLNIYKKAVTKKKLYDENFFKVDREYVEKQTSLDVEHQLICDANLSKVNIIKVSDNDPDLIYFNVEVFASVLSSEDIKILDSVSAKVQIKSPKGVKQKQRDRIILALKNSIECKNYDVLMALKDWIDAIMADPKRVLSKPQVAAFKYAIDDYCDGDVAKALDVIHLAIIHQYVDCQWAINLYERGNRPASIPQQNITIAANRVTDQKITTSVSEEIF